MKRRIIALTGFATAGKDAVGRILVERHGMVRVGFADALKQRAIDGYMIGGKMWYWDGVSKGPLERANLQFIGEAERARDPLVWVRIALGRIESRELRGRDIAITDCRYHNEAVNLTDRGASLWRILRAGVGPANAHVSESEHLMFSPDAIIRNDCHDPACPYATDPHGICETLADTVAAELARITRAG